MFPVMIITLKNFKCWENATFSAIDNGITLVSGNSGCGKSSIIQAVYFALYGKGHKVVRIGTSSCSVEVQIAGMRIVRTKRPNRLVVNDIHEDAVGQSVIDKVFGKNFDIVSYIAQDSFGSLVYMTASARLEFLEKFAFENVDIDAIKSGVKLAVRADEDERLRQQAALQFAQKTLDEIRVPDTVDAPEEDLHDINTLTRELDDARQSHSARERRVADAESALKHHVTTTARVRDIESEIDTMRADLESLGHIEDISDTVDLLRAAEKYAAYSDAVANRDTLEEQCATMRVAEQNKWNSQKDALASSLWDRMSRAECLAEIERLAVISEANKRYMDAERRMDKLRKYRDEYVAIRAYSGKPAKCPECNCALSVIDGGDVIHAHAQDDAKTERASKIRKKYEEYVVLERNKNVFTPGVDMKEIQTYFDKNIYTEKKLSEYSVFSVSESLAALQKKLERVRKNICDPAPENPGVDSVSLRAKISAHATVSEAHSRLSRRIASKTKTLQKLVSELGDVQALEKELSESRADLVSSSKLLYDLEKAVGNAYSVRTAWDRYNAYVTQRENIDATQARVDSAARALKSAEVELSHSLELKEIVARAESDCLDTIINTINIHAQHFIDLFFQTNPMTVLLSSYKQVVTGKSVRYKPQINLTVQYKGADTALASLSGGERARVSLAFTLALSEIYHSPILMLDESISSLDHDATTDVLDAIKDTAGERAVLVVSHQANTGMFDGVISI